MLEFEECGRGFRYLLRLVELDLNLTVETKQLLVHMFDSYHLELQR
jgi:hypothetical protein